MHHELFANQRRLGADLYEELTNKNNLNVPSFLACLGDPGKAQLVVDNLSNPRTAL